MNKKTVAVSMALICATALCGCAKKPKTDLSPAPQSTRSEVQTRDNTADERPDAIGNIDIRAIVIEKSRPPFSGVRKRISVIDGEYKTEYIHSNAGSTNTPDYTVKFDDDTFDLKIDDSENSKSYYGHYYVHCGGSITMFFDNVSADQDPASYLYAELLPSGKIMLYDNNNVAVLANADHIPDRENGMIFPDFLHNPRPMPLPIGARYLK